MKRYVLNIVLPTTQSKKVLLFPTKECHTVKWKGELQQLCGFAVKDLHVSYFLVYFLLKLPRQKLLSSENVSLSIIRQNETNIFELTFSTPNRNLLYQDHNVAKPLLLTHSLAYDTKPHVTERFELSERFSKKHKTQGKCCQS